MRCSHCVPLTLGLKLGDGAGVGHASIKARPDTLGNGPVPTGGAGAIYVSADRGVEDAKGDLAMTTRIKLTAPVADIYRAVAALEQLYPGRKFTPDGHLVGSMGEVIVRDLVFENEALLLLRSAA